MTRKATLLFILISVTLFPAALSQVTGYSFIASQGTFITITGGTRVTLTGNGTDPVQDEGYANNIPLGFAFNYLGVNYTSISASTNGFASFGILVSSFFSNHLSSGAAARPLLAPLWEDLSLSTDTGMQYLTTGPAGSRIFTLQWSNVLYDFGAGAAAISFQLRLHETINRIEFIYNQLPGTVQDFSGGASIGITSANPGNGSFLSLDNSSASPAVSSVVTTNTIVTRPATGQVYAFAPPGCIAPGNLNATGITGTGATISWAAGGATTFEYAVTTNTIPPASGTATSFTSAFAGGLVPGTRYYLHVRKDCSGVMSGWANYSFVTNCDAATLPYVMPLSSVTPPALPVCVVTGDDNQDNNTWRTYASAGAGWTDQVIAYVYNYNTTTPANDWLFTAGLNLSAGTSYRLKFKYNNDATSLYPEKLKVAYGTNPASAGMTNILADHSAVYSPSPESAVIDFIPATSGIFYIGFQAYSDANMNVLILDDISVDLTPSCDLPENLNAVVQPDGESVNVTWQDPSIGSPSGYEYAVTGNSNPPSSGTTTVDANAFVAGLIAHSEYYLHVRTLCGGAFSDWATLAFATVGNDEACSAISLTAGASPVCGNTTLATSGNDLYSACSTPNNSVWYKYTASVTGTVVLKITTPASPADPLHGWATWYNFSGNCSDAPLYEISACQQFGNNGNNDTDYLVSPVLVAGNTYYIMIDGSSDDVGEFCISLPACSPAININVRDIMSAGANVNWQGTGTFIMEYGPAGFVPGTGTVGGAGGTIINPAVSPQAINSLTVSTSYDVYVRQDCSVAGNGFSNNTAVTSFTTLAQPPPNDDCSGAIQLTVFDDACGGATAGTTLNATPSGVMPLPQCSNINAGYDDDVWFTFTPNAGQQFVNITFTYAGGYIDPVAQVYTSSDNTCSGIFTAIQCSDDEGGQSMPGFYGLPVTAGTTYFIRVFTHQIGVNSQFTVCITRGLLVNDNASGAIRLFVDDPCTGASYTNEGATQTEEEPTGSCSSTTGYATVWYKFEAPAGGAVRISTALGSGNTLNNTRMALFIADNASNYASFNIIACDEDGGSGAFDNMSVLYATGLTEGWTYYIQVDKYDQQTNTGTFCIMVETLTTAMLSANNNCSSNYQAPVGSVTTYKGWVPLMDADSKLIALVRNNNGGAAGNYSIMQNVHAGGIREDEVSGEYYLDRSFTITNTTTGNNPVNVRLFYLQAELTALAALDPAAAVNRLRVTRQSGADCQPHFIDGNGTNTDLPQSLNDYGSYNGVNWISFTTTGLSNFYIHSTRSRVLVKTFLQGAYNPATGRHKDVTPAWANVLNTYARNQPYNTPAFGNYAGTESVPPGFFTSTPGSSDIVDWVLLETKNGFGTIISRRAAFIREDGLIVDIDKGSPVSMYGQGAGSNNIFIRHRNHLGIRTSNLQTFTPVALGSNQLIFPYDFTTGQDKAYQNAVITSNAAMAQSSTKYLMWAGNANGDDFVRVTTQALPPILSDVAYILAGILGGNPNLTLTGYSAGDINLDGNVRATTQALPPIPSDASFILANPLIGNNNSTRREHR